MTIVCEQLQEIIERVDAARPALNFELPPELEANAPPEARGLARDGVRLMVSHRSDDSVEHATFRDITNYLDRGDLVVINTSGTMNAALEATAPGGRAFELHLSTHLPGDLWVVEVRQPSPSGTKPCASIAIASGPRAVLPPTSWTLYALANANIPSQKFSSQATSGAGSVRFNRNHAGSAPIAARSLRFTASAL